MDEYFPGASYDTPPGVPRRLGDRLALNTRWYFVGGYAHVVLWSRSAALKGRYDNKTWAKASHEIFRLIEGCGGCFHLRGLDNLRACKPPVVFISNHMSTLETFVFPCIIAPLMDVTYVVKKSLVKGVFGPVMRSRDPIVVGRENAREDFATVMTEGRKLLAKGTSIVIFPQSTRAADFQPEKFNTLGIKLAKAVGVQAMPVAIKTDFWGNGKFLLKDYGPVDRNKSIHMTFGEPFSINGTGKDEHQKVVDFIAGHLREWGVKA